MFKKRNGLRVVTIGLLLAISWTCISSEIVRGVEDKTYKELQLFSQVFDLVRDRYVKEPDTKELIYGALKGMTRTLDPYSQFLEPTAYQEVTVETEGKYEGLGIHIGIREGWLTVITPMIDTPAYRAGLLPGDRIIKIEGKTTEGMSLLDAVKVLRGEKGTSVTITISREGEEPFEVTIVRDVIKIKSVRQRMLTPTIGYIKVASFTKATNEELKKALRELKSGGMESLILDLRNNPGGLLVSAVDVCKNFVGEHKLIVYTQEREPGKVTKFRANRTAEFGQCPLVVLVNQGSASGSEIVAGCIKDWERGVILGEKTFGKGCVQSVLPLSEGAGLRLTTALYYTPLGICIDEKGIEPDVEVTMSKDLMVKLMKQEMKAEIIPKPAAETEEEEKEKKEEVKDPQIEAAIHLLEGARILGKQLTPSTTALER